MSEAYVPRHRRWMLARTRGQTPDPRHRRDVPPDEVARYAAASNSPTPRRGSDGSGGDRAGTR